MACPSVLREALRGSWIVIPDNISEVEARIVARHKEAKRCGLDGVIQSVPANPDQVSRAEGY